MSSDALTKRRNKLPRKAYTKSRTVSVEKARRGKSGISVARIMRGTKYRSHFEIGLAKALSEKNITFEYENSKFTYIPKPRTYTPDFYLPTLNIYVEITTMNQKLITKGIIFNIYTIIVYIFIMI